MGNKQNNSKLKNSQERPDQDYFMLNSLQKFRFLQLKSFKIVLIGQNLDTAKCKQLQEFEMIKRVSCFQSWQQLNNVINAEQNQYFLLISFLQLTDKIYNQYCLHHQIFRTFSLSYDNPNYLKFIQANGRIITFNDFQDLFQKINRQMRLWNRYGQFPKFCKTNNYNVDQNLFFLSLYTLTLTRNRKQAKSDLIRFCQKAYPKQKQYNLKIFERQYSESEPTIQSIINWYTKQTFFYKILTKLLVSTDDPLQMAYIRLPFFDMFNAIKKIYKNNLNKQKRNEYYRGTHLTENELDYFRENEGNLIQTLGFLNANKNRKMAQEYSDNVLFIIEVGLDMKVNCQMDNGYADISYLSINFDEEQVVFNAFNVFRIKKVLKFENNTIIYLKYGQLVLIEQKIKNNLHCTELQIKQLNEFKTSTNLIKQNIKTQGDLLFQMQRFSQAIEFYKIYFFRNKTIGYQKEKQNRKQYQQFGKLQLQNKNYNDALEKFNRCLQIDLMLYGQFHSITANTYLLIALVHKSKLNRKKALEFYMKAMKVLIMIENQDHVSLCNVYKCIADIFYEFNEFAKCLQYYFKMSKIHSNTFGKMSQILGEDYNRIAQAYKNLKEYEKALYYYKRCEDIYLVHFKQDNPIIAILFSNIGSVLNKIQRIQQSIQYLHKALKIRIRIHGQAHSSIASSYNQLALIYKSIENYEKSLEYYLKCLEIDLKLLGDNHHSIAASYNNIGIIYHTIQQLGKASEYYGLALQILKLNENQNLDSITITYSNLGEVHRSQQNFEQALQYQFKALKLLINKYGQNSPQIAQSYINIADIYSDIQENQKALKYYKKCIEIQQKKNNKFNALTATAYNNLGLIYDEKGEFDKAIELYLKCLNIQIKLYNQYHPSIAQTFLNLGMSYKDNQQFQKGFNCFSKCYKIRYKIYGQDDNLTEEALENLMICKHRLLRK